MQLSIATGKSRNTKVWKNTKISWNALVEKLSETERTHETYKEYNALSKEEKANIKDHGGFVGGYLKGGSRHPTTVVFRQLLTLDLDSVHNDFWHDFEMFYSCEAILHSTHRHSAKTPGFRLIIPLDRPVSAEQYEAIARRIGGSLDINLFDPTTFQPERLMYWPTTAKDGVYVFEHQEGAMLSADAILDSYVDWQDISEWPMLEAEKDFVRLGGKQQGKPSEKPGLVGAFCRAYTIHQAIETFLSDVYEETGNEDRFTFSGGSAAAGAIVYGDSEYLYSHHGTDPISGKLVNAFDLVRLHRFGFEDQGEKELSKQKSNKLMNDFASADPLVVKENGLRKLAKDDFDDDFEEADDSDMEWLGHLSVDKNGEYQQTIPNFYAIIANDTRLKGRLKFDLFSQREYAELPLPWKKGSGMYELTDKDDAELRHYIESRYNLYHATKCKDAIDRVFNQNSYHPIRDYIDALVWDGTHRLDTLLMDYQGAEDTTFNRLATRKALVAAVARVYRPGCKMDYTLTLVGPEGLKKSTIFQKLGGQWFSDSFVGVEGIRSFEQLQGSWLIEMGELSSVRKADVESVKHFLTKRDDRFRVAYGKRIVTFPRQCVFFGSTNERHFLKGTTGNRRFWPVAVDGFGIMDVEDIPVDQIWAEAKALFDAGEKLYFDEDVEQEAREIQQSYTETDDREGLISNYLKVLLPTNWDEMDYLKRRHYLADPLDIEERGEVPRVAVCVAEIWSEVFRAEPKDMGPHNTKYIHQIMTSMPGWEAKKSNLTFPIYGKQRAYVVNENVSRHNRRNAKRIIK
jgi:putative DNA primase/helicase